MTDPKGSSTHHEDTKITLSANPNVPSTHHEDTKITLSANLNVPSQTVSPTARVRTSASVQMMPTTNTTSAACSGKQVGFTHVVFAMILVNFCCNSSTHLVQTVVFSNIHLIETCIILRDVILKSE